MAMLLLVVSLQVLSGNLGLKVFSVVLLFARCRKPSVQSKLFFLIHIDVLYKTKLEFQISSKSKISFCLLTNFQVKNDCNLSVERIETCVES